MLGFSALSEAALGEVEVSVSGTGAVTLDIVAAASGAHGAAGVAAVALDIAAVAEGEYQSINISGDAAVTLSFAVSATGGHGVTGAAAVTLDMFGEAVVGHGVASDVAATLDLVAAASAAHGVAGHGAVTLTLTAVAVAAHERYELRGEVRQGGVLVNRRVRAYRRDSGTLVGEADTVAGRFSVHTGLEPREHYIVPIDVSEGAADWTPAVANRVTSVLAQDT
jgi:hypothetical protein